MRWSPEPGVDGLRAFEAIEDDRADSHPAGQPHITADGDSYRFTMHTVDRDISRDRQRQEVRGMTSAGRDLILGRGERWRITYSMFIPGTLRATTSFTHIMQTKAPGAGSLPMLTMSLRRQGSTPRIELRATQGNVQIGATNLTPLQNRWIDVELEMTIGDANTGRVRWVLRDGARTVVDVTRSNVDTWLADRVRFKWGIYRSLGDTSGSLQNCHMLIRDLRAYEWSETAAPPTSVKLEAESARILQGAVDTSHRGYTGSGYVRPDGANRLAVEWTVDAAAAGTATLTFAYANFSGGDRPVDIAVNGALVANDFAFIPTPAWHEWDTRTIRAPVRAGTNTIRATVATAGSGPNLDNLGVQLAAGGPPEPPPGTDHQAEDATIVGGAAESVHAGFTGTGYVNYDNAAGGYVEWTVTAAAAGPTALTFRYANGSTGDRPMDITVGGVVAAGLAFPATGAWTTWRTVTVTVPLSAGGNTIRVTATTAGGGPNLDKVTVGQK